VDRKAQSLTAAVKYWAQRLKAYYQRLTDKQALQIVGAATVHFMSQNSEQIWQLAQQVAQQQTQAPPSPRQVQPGRTTSQEKFKKEHTMEIPLPETRQGQIVHSYPTPGSQQVYDVLISSPYSAMISHIHESPEGGGGIVLMTVKPENVTEVPNIVNYLTQNQLLAQKANNNDGVILVQSPMTQTAKTRIPYFGWS